MTAPRTLLIILAVLFGGSPVLAAETAVLPVRGTLDGDLADRIARDIRKRIDEGVRTLVFEFDLLGAPESGLSLADAIRDAGASVRTVAYVRGRAPGSGLAAALACRLVWADRGARFGPIPKRGAVHDRVAGQLATLRASAGTLALLLPRADESGGLSAGDAKKQRIVKRVIENASALYAELGVTPGAVPEEEVLSGRRRVTGTFRRPFLIPFVGPIDDTRAASVRRRVETALAAGADLLIFEIDSPGGTVSASLDAGDYVYGLEVPTVMLILKGAYSGAALFALAGDEIVMSASGVLGDCQPISVGPEGITVLGEKIQSPLRATFRKYAEKNGYPAALAEAMVTQEMEVDRVTLADGTVAYVTPDERSRLEAGHGPVLEETVVVKKDQLLTMHGREARELGFCGELVADRPAALARFGLSESDLTILEETWAEQTSRFLLGLKFLLFIVGIMALYMELKAPGFGVPGALAILCFALFFSASAIAGIATELEIILFLLGVGLLALELLVIPGFGVPGLLGIGLIVASLYMASIKYGLPASDRPWEMKGFLNWLLAFGGTVVASVIGILIIAKIIPGTPFGKRIILAPAGPAGSRGLTASASERAARIAGLKGKTGIATTDLRPAGRIDIEGEPWDAVTEGDYVPKGAKVLVVEAGGNRIVVKGLEA